MDAQQGQQRGDRDPTDVADRSEAQELRADAVERGGEPDNQRVEHLSEGREHDHPDQHLECLEDRLEPLSRQQRDDGRDEQVDHHYQQRSACHDDHQSGQPEDHEEHQRSD